MTSGALAYDAAAAAWFEALRQGSSSTWAEWRADHPQVSAASTRPACSGLQLEVIRRVAAVGPLPGFDRLADTIASTPAFGRGLGDVPLPWPGRQAFGPPAVEPETLPAEQLLRVAVPALVRLGSRLPVPPPPAVPSNGRRWRRGYVVTGPPSYAASVRDQLRAAGLRVGGRRGTGIVVIAPFEHAMFDVWTHRVRAGGAIGWRRFWTIRSRAGRLPVGVDVGTQITRISQRTRSVHVVIGADPSVIARQVADIVGVPVAAPMEESWRRTDLRRRINRVAADGSGSIAARVLALAPPDPARIPRAPRAHRRWAEETGRRLAGEVQALVASGGYPVHGNIADLLGATDPGADAPVSTTAEETLELAVHAIRGIWPCVRSGAGTSSGSGAGDG